ncbi:MAG: DUF354 domain-containing protein [Chlorobi bacterium]|nr:DUF354 domain-containing protein [Chlorobiota bacterium]
MKILFHLNHPAHFHLFKLAIKSLISKGHEILILINKKDILEELLKKSELPYFNILPSGRKNSKIGIAIGLLKQDSKIIGFCLKHKPDLLVGTSVPICHTGKLLNIPAINVNEDDADVVPLFSKLGYPAAKTILSPEVCSTGKWKYKTINYNGYHELAYLHPNHFTPDVNIVKKYTNPEEPFFIIRFSGLNAHHDSGKSGINTQISNKLIKILEPHGRIIITSERELEPEFEKYRLNVNVLEMHHMLAFAKIFIGDSQTMAAESGVLGTPFVRFNDFVGRIGYLAELEVKYKLGYGIKTENTKGLYQIVQELIETRNLENIYIQRLRKMLSEKIDLAKFLTWFLENYPNSIDIMKQNPDFQYKFK